MNGLGTWRLAAAAFVGFLAMAGHAVAEEQRVYFIAPKDGAEVVSPVNVVMGVEGMEGSSLPKKVWSPGRGITTSCSTRAPCAAGR